MSYETATRPIRLETFIKNSTRFVWANVNKCGKVGVTPEFLLWLNRQLEKRGKNTIDLKPCVVCGDKYWVLGKRDEEFRCCD